MGGLRSILCLLLSCLLLCCGCRGLDSASGRSAAAERPETTPVIDAARPRDGDLPASQQSLVRPLPPAPSKPAALSPPPASAAKPAKPAKAAVAAVAAVAAKAAPRPPVRVPSAVPPPPAYPLAGGALETPGYPKSQSPSADIKKAEGASLALDRSIQAGELRANFYGTGDPMDMVCFEVLNVSPRAIRVELVPGMILNPGESHKVQPLLLTESVTLSLQPGEGRSGTLLSYCMDSRLPAPAYGEAVDYRFSQRTKDGGPEAVRAYQAARKVAGSGPYTYAITQIAIWKSLGQPVEEKHLRSLLGPSASDARVRAEVLREVDRVLRSR